nr:MULTISPECIES: NAD(P)H-dependent oxidoreductase [unclassified Mycolicibacterium]
MCVSGSTKASKSATRALMRIGSDLLIDHVRVTTLDLSSLQLPIYAGHPPKENPNAAVGVALSQVSLADAVVFGIPCYWGLPAGPFINFIDLMCGPAYDLPTERTAFSGLPVGVLLVGADPESAILARKPVEKMLSMIGADLVDEPLLVANPRHNPNAAIIRDVSRLFVETAKLAAVRYARRRRDGA